MSSCQNKYENLLENNTSEIRQYLFEGKSENISASLIIGMREKNYIVITYFYKICTMHNYYAKFNFSLNLDILKYNY